LFVWSGLVVTVYVLGMLTVIGVGVAAMVGDLDGVERRVADLGTVGVVSAVLLVVVVVATTTLVLGWRGLSWATLGFSAARRPEPGEAHQVVANMRAFALAYGMPPPSVWVVDDPAPNALVFGRPAAGSVCVTSGALALGDVELDALCAFEVSALASRAHAYATSAADLVLLGEWCTRMLWLLLPLVALSVIFGVPGDVAVAFFVGTVLLVVMTRPLIVAAARGLVRLFDDIDELVDLETMRHTLQPASIAQLLLAMVEDPRRASSRWEIDHLWFERDVVDVDRAFAALLPETDGLSLRAHGGATPRRALLERAGAAIDQAGGDAALTHRLERAATVRG
jgi:hypothetical protein